jgi:broad specificity phosphatase PhoE
MVVVRRSKHPLMVAQSFLRAARGTVFVLRHGSTDRNRGGVGNDLVRGHCDVPMTEGGKSEVRITALLLSGEHIEYVYTSDLGRAVSSAEIISDENCRQPGIEESAALRSWDMGPSMEGVVTTPDVVARICGLVRSDGEVPPGGESFRGFVSRLLGFVGPVFADTLEHGGVCAIMAHGRCVQVIDLWVAAGCDETCMHAEFSDYLADEPDTVPPGGGVRFKHDGVGWIGQVINTGAASLGTRIAAGEHMRPANAMVNEREGIAS